MLLVGINTYLINCVINHAVLGDFCLCNFSVPPLPPFREHSQKIVGRG